MGVIIEPTLILVLLDLDKLAIKRVFSTLDSAMRNSQAPTVAPVARIVQILASALADLTVAATTKIIRHKDATMETLDALFTIYENGLVLKPYE